MQIRFFARLGIRTFALSFALMVAAGSAGWSAASAYTLKTLYSFCAKTNCPDGNMPAGGLLMDAAGDLYGTTVGGGLSAFASGTVFELISNAKKTKWTEKVLYEFCAKTNCADGEDPASTLIADKSGDLYGTTRAGGKTGQGVAFELMPNAKHTKWKLKVLYDFCSVGGTSCLDGDAFSPLEHASLTYAGAATGAPYDGTSPLYGTTIQGAVGTDGGLGPGVVFELTPGKKKWSETVLHVFCQAISTCKDGLTPIAGLIVDASGNLYGTTLNGRLGGVGNGGTVYEISPNAGQRAWTETVLYFFCPEAVNCTDGGSSFAELLLDGSGNLFGTTQSGGAVETSCAQGCGVAFKLVPDGALSTETVVYDFCSLTNCTDGTSPTAPLIMDSSSNLFGTTASGGANNQGTVFKLNGTEQVLYSFCAQASCTDGRSPQAGLIMDAKGNLFGTASGGGPNNGGTVFELVP